MNHEFDNKMTETGTRFLGEVCGMGRITPSGSFAAAIFEHLVTDGRCGKRTTHVVGLGGGVVGNSS